MIESSHFELYTNKVIFMEEFMELLEMYSGVFLNNLAAASIGAVLFVTVMGYLGFPFWLWCPLCCYCFVYCTLLGFYYSSFKTSFGFIWSYETF